MKPLHFSAFIRTFSLISFIAFAANAQQGPPANVNVTSIQNTTLSPVAWVSGSVVSRNNSQIAADVSGRLISLASLGSKVKKNQVIAELDDRTLKLKYDEADALVANAQAKLTFEAAEVTRKKTLVEKKLISEKELEEAISNLNIAKANAAAAKAKLEQIAQDITYTKLKAPFDGIVAERLSNQGEYVNNGNAIIRLVETANVEASLFAPLTAYRFLKESKQLAIKSPLGEGRADIKAIIPVADSRSHLMEVRLDMSPFDWPIGLDIKAAVATGNSKQVLATHRDALVLRRDTMSIFIIDTENKAKQVNVTVGISEGDLIEVIGDIQAGDQVVIRGAERLRAGQTVNIKTNNDKLISGKSAMGTK
ncbi:efflux RND transporter periplasmic adaptor subunit [Colwellia sp. 1_MG-2023]|uniref:efflux RND transporter periplasmic adaptor subunit n=1 Tax=Colwellia sp. 1_MG-2023 TaxID=3062649 RepID=UPI0026E225B2|nr:efflux RND transporter periplasmic adaptor subunit [Colwellia sp. 1_MG-2023]MDO6445468.1 efflux RND transporter periplasmic adaptor subunit [Colwellia sp. 1_MG-2023]